MMLFQVPVKYVYRVVREHETSKERQPLSMPFYQLQIALRKSR